MADTLGSVGVIISTLLIQFYGWTGFDPIASLFIAVMIAASVIPLVVDCARVLSLDIGTREASVRQALGDVSSYLFLKRVKHPLIYVLFDIVIFDMLLYLELLLISSKLLYFV